MIDLNKIFGISLSYNEVTGKPNSTEMITPIKTASNMINLIHEEEWNKDTKFFDIACKSGNFLREILDKLMRHPSMIKEFPDEVKREEHILNNQLYGVALTELSEKVATRNVYGCVCKGNIKYIENWVGIIKTKNYKETINKIQEVFGIMQFDVIIGNPPFQSTSNKSSVYQLFIENAVQLADTVVMITRDNWMNGKAFKFTRDSLTRRGSIAEIVHYPKVGEVFNGVSVAVAYFMWCKGKNTTTLYRCIKDGNEVLKQELDITNGIIYKSELGKSILNKIGNKSNWSTIYNTRSYPFMDQRKRNNMQSSLVQDGEHDIEVIINGSESIYVSINNFLNKEEVRSYKVVCGVIINEASIESPGNVLTNIRVIDKDKVASETWSLASSFDTKEEANNCKKYLMTRFVRFITNQSVNGRSNVTDNTFECVPVQNFTSSSDIDWSKSIIEIEKQLYEKYGLSNDEIKYIESTVKIIDNMN